jgi:hypothetical protein
MQTVTISAFISSQTAVRCNKWLQDWIFMVHSALRILQLSGGHAFKLVPHNITGQPATCWDAVAM